MKHKITRRNIGSFVEELKAVLQKYDAHVADSDITLITSNLSFHAKEVANCPPQCIRTQKVCDIHHRNCHIEYWCECPPNAEPV